jgi:hypothetical protein
MLLLMFPLRINVLSENVVGEMEKQQNQET